MNQSGLLQALMRTPEPKPADEPITVGPDFDIPIHDAKYTRIALLRWPQYAFPNAASRKLAAQRIAERAMKFGIVGEGLKIARGK